MNLVELVQITSSEEEAEKFLRAKGILKTFDRCPFCGHQKIERIRRSFFKCYGCRKEWCIRKDSIIKGLKVPFTKFILAVKLFTLEVPVNKACKELKLAYNTTHKMDNRIRQCIFKFVSLVMYGFKHERIDKSIKFSNGKIYIIGIEGFWGYTKERLLKFHGVSREYFVWLMPLSNRKTEATNYLHNKSLKNQIYSCSTFYKCFFTQ
jgi:transposase-like protein